MLSKLGFLWRKKLAFPDLLQETHSQMYEWFNTKDIHILGVNVYEC